MITPNPRQNPQNLVAQSPGTRPVRANGRGVVTEVGQAHPTKIRRGLQPIAVKYGRKGQ